MKKIILILIFIVNILALGLTGVYLYSYMKDPSLEVSWLDQPTPSEEEITDKTGSKESFEPPRVKVDSRPPEVKVFLDGYLKGRTPVEFRAVSEKHDGQYLLTLVEPGYKKAERNITLSSGEEKEIDIKLKKIEDENN